MDVGSPVWIGLGVLVAVVNMTIFVVSFAINQAHALADRRRTRKQIELANHDLQDALSCQALSDGGRGRPGNGYWQGHDPASRRGRWPT